MGDKYCRRCGEIFFAGMHVKHRYGLYKNSCPICETDRFVGDWR